MTQSLPNVSQSIDDLLQILEPYGSFDEVIIPRQSYQSVLLRLAAIRRMAGLMERELGSFRLLEGRRGSRSLLNDLSATTALPIEQDGNVIRPDFGGRS